MNNDHQPLRVLIIGSGKRVQNNFIPSFNLLPNYFTLVGIHSRTKEHYESVAQRFGIPPIAQLTPELLDRVDVVAISVPMDVWPIFLPQMMFRAKELTLIIDTPLILHSLSLYSLLSRFKRVVVTEDYISFPAFTLLREIVDTGALGKITNVRLVKNGFRYHGTSLIRSFYSFAVATRFTSKVCSPDNVSLILEFTDGRCGEIIEPYEGDAGYIEVTGENGSITTDKEIGTHTYRLISETNDGHINAYAADIDGKTYRITLTHGNELRKMGIDDQFQIEKNHGLLEVFSSIVADTIHSKYHFTEALYDNYVSRTPRIASVAMSDIPVAMFGDAVIRSFGYWVYWRILSYYIRLKRRLVPSSAGSAT